MNCYTPIVNWFKAKSGFLSHVDFYDPLLFCSKVMSVSQVSVFLMCEPVTAVWKSCICDVMKHMHVESEGFC